MWDRHVALCFASASTAPHSLTTDYIQGILSYKGFWGLFEIVRVFVRRLLAPEEELFLVATVSAAYLIMGLLKSAGKKRPCRLEGSLFAWSWFVYLCYLAGMLAMYLFSMPLEDALELGSFNRYLCTATAYLVGICIIYLLNELDTVSVGGYLPCLLAAVSLSFLIVTSPVRMTTVFYDVLDHTTTEKHQLKEIKSAYAIPDGASCCIITSSEDAWLKRKAAYELWSDQIVILSDAAKPLPQEVLHNYDYLILLDASPNMEAFLSINHIPSGQRVYALSELR